MERTYAAKETGLPGHYICGHSATNRLSGKVRGNPTRTIRAPPRCSEKGNPDSGPNNPGLPQGYPRGTRARELESKKKKPTRVRRTVLPHRASFFRGRTVLVPYGQRKTSPLTNGATRSRRQKPSAALRAPATDAGTSRQQGGERRHERTTPSPPTTRGARALADRPLYITMTTVAIMVEMVLPPERLHIAPATSGLTSVALVLALEAA